MPEVPLVIPFLISPHTSVSGLPVQPTHVASWSIPSNAGPSKRIALAGKDNSIWITTLPRDPLPPPSPSPSDPPLNISQPVPVLLTPTSGTSTPTRFKGHSHEARPRAPSVTSSIHTTSSAHRHRGSTFSPPPPALLIPKPTLSSVTAVPETHSHRDSESEHAELLDHLRGQRGPESTHPEDRGIGLGLGLPGLGRRGLPGVHGKEEHEHSGTTSPRSVVSAESNKTVASRLRGWAKQETVEEEGLKERIEEIEVEIEVEKEVLEEQREAEDLKVVEAARGAVTPKEDSVSAWTDGQLSTRVVLRTPGLGKISCFKVVDDVGLCVLRDTG